MSDAVTSHTGASIPAQAEEQESMEAHKALQQGELSQRKNQVLKASI